MSDWHLQNTDKLTRSEQATVVAAIIHYSLAMADPTVACFALDKLAPRIDGEEWYEWIEDARTKLRPAGDNALEQGPDVTQGAAVPVPQSLRA